MADRLTVAVFDDEGAVVVVLHRGDRQVSIEIDDTGYVRDVSAIDENNRLCDSSDEPTQATAILKSVDWLTEPAKHDDEWTSDCLADELLRLDVERDWPRLRELILAAEDSQFTPEQSALLAPCLLGLAVRYRDSNDQQDAAAVWSAIRTGASMLRPSEASPLLPLLDPGHPIETSLVARKMLGRIFEAADDG